MPAPGDLIGGKYRLVRVIGEGGMGTVYEARHEHLGSPFALKFLHPDLAQRPALVARFLQEARVSAAIRSPHVTQVVDVDQTPDGAAYLVMELLDGESLDHRLARSSPLPLFDAIDIGLQILSALEAAHAQGVVHRDLKPDNVWLCPPLSAPLVKLLDFGIAKLKSSHEFRQVTTRPGSMMGTPAYMAPEQAISADQVDHRADLYSFGVILYEMLSGARPVDTDDPGEILSRLSRGEIHPLATRNPRVPPGVAELVDRLVAPNPDERPASAALARTELARHARGSIPDRGPVPATLPPDDAAAPPFAASVHAVPPARVITDAMPQMPDIGSRATAIRTLPVPPPASKGRGAMIFGGALLVGLAALGVWAYLNQSAFDDTAAPPLPGPAPSVAVALVAVDAGVAGDPVRRAPRPRQVLVPRPSPGEPTATNTVAPPVVPSALPQMPFPFAIPSGMIPIPSALPPFFQALPGMFAPSAPAPSGPTPASSR